MNEIDHLMLCNSSVGKYKMLTAYAINDAKQTMLPYRKYKDYVYGIC